MKQSRNDRIARENRYTKNVIIFMIRVRKYTAMQYRFVLVLIILCMLAAVPASADLGKIAMGATVYIGETDLDLSSALDGSRQIAWFAPGNTTEDPADLVLTFTEADAFSYDISPEIFANRTGTWYKYYPKPRIPLFSVAKPYFNLSVYDLDHKRDVTGQEIPRSTNITYRIDTNLYTAFNEIQRPDNTPQDTFVTVTLTNPNDKPINSIYTASAGSAGVLLYPVEQHPIIKQSPYFWKYGDRWNHSARGYDGTVLYPLGTYTFSATQNLNNMQQYYGISDPVITTGPRTVTFVADATVPTVTKTVMEITVPATTVSVVETPAETVPATKTTATLRPTWTSTPLPPQVTLLALGIVAVLYLYRGRRS